MAFKREQFFAVCRIEYPGHSVLPSDGNALDNDELVESDVILPPRDISFEEAKAEFTGDGLIPD